MAATPFRSTGLRILVLLLPASFATGQSARLRGPLPNAVQASPRYSPDTYGTLSSVVYTVWASDLQILDPATSTEGDQDGNTGGRRCGDANCSFLAGAHLPNGAVLESVELEACDASATEEMVFLLFRAVAPGQEIEFLSAGAGTGEAATPGCALFTSASALHTVDNATGAYAAVVQVPADPDLLLNAVRFRYRLQVSPAPGTATFNDVPTGHPQFQFIEALVASGITAGCGSGNYCPDANLTRGQMAVFLSKALGLHFPN